MLIQVHIRIPLEYIDSEAVLSLYNAPYLPSARGEASFDHTNLVYVPTRSRTATLNCMHEVDSSLATQQRDVCWFV